MPILIATFVVSLVTFHLLERLHPIHRGYRTGPRRRGYRADLFAALVNGPGLSGLTKLAASALLLKLPASVSFLAGWPLWGQFAAFFLFNDFARYWLHRWYHHSDLLWRIHRVHHATVEMDSLSLLRIHLLEAVIKNFGLALPLRLLGVDPVVIVTYSCLDVVKGFWHHSNFKSHVGPINYIFNTAELHWWHHSVERRGHRSNYGSILSIWDWLFGTAYWPRGEWPEEIGVRGMENFSDHYFPQLASIRFSDEELRARLAEQAPTPSIEGHSPDPQSAAPPDRRAA